MNRQQSIAYVGGKSGGHIIPALTLASQNHIIHPTHTIIFFSTSRTLDTTVINSFSKQHLHISLSFTTHTYRNPCSVFLLILQLIYACIYSFYILKKEQTTRLVSMGGLVSLPVCLAAKLLRIPIEVYELNAVPGKAVTLLAKIANRIHVCFPEAKNYFSEDKVIVSPYPIRYKYSKNTFDKQSICSNVGLDSAKKVLFVLGGSQGSLFINTLIKQWIEHHPFLAQSLNVIHQTGAADQTDWASWYASKHVTAHCFSYEPDVQQYYQVADVIVCRSGAGTLFECLFFNKKIITIPLQTATTSHQYDNAHALSARYPHLITVIEQEKIRTSLALFFNNLNALL